MRRFLFIFIAIAGSVINCPAQCVLLKVDFNDCALCTASSAVFIPSRTGLPVYVVYPNSSRADSADLDYAGKFSRNHIQMLFNDYWNEKLNCTHGLSCVFGLNRYGDIVYTSSLKTLVQAEVDTFLARNKAEPPIGEIYNGALQYSHNNLGVIKILNTANGEVVKTIRTSELDLQLLANKMAKNEKRCFEKYGAIINKEITPFLAKFIEIRLDKKGDLYVLLSYHNTPDSISVNITDESCILHYDAKGNYKDVYLIEKQKRFFIKCSGFLPVSDDTLCLITEDRAKATDRTANFLSRFVKKDGRYTFAGYIPLPLPYIYRYKYGVNYLTAGNSYSPLVVTTFSNTIYNINSRKTVCIIDSATYMAGIDTATHFDPAKSIMTNEKLHVFSVVPVAGKQQLYSLTYTYDNKLFIDYYTTDLKKQSSYSWDAAGMMGNAILYAEGIEGKDAVSMLYQDGHKIRKSVIIPLSLFHPVL